GRAAFPRGEVRADFDGHLFRAGVRLDQSDGFMQADAQMGMTWGADIAPHAAEDEPAFATLKASRFQAGAILPFVAGALSELEARIDGDARIEIGGEHRAPRMSGALSLSDGLVQISRIGEPFHGVAMNMALTPDGLIRLQNAVAYGSTGK